MDPTTAIGGASLAISALTTLLIVVRKTLTALAEARAKDAETRRVEAEAEAIRESTTAGSLHHYEERLRATERARDEAQRRVALLERELRKRGITPSGGVPAVKE